MSLGLTHFYARDFEAAADAFEALISRDAEFAPAYAFLGQVRTEMGSPTEGMRCLDRAIQLAGESPEWMASVGVVRARMGDRAGSEEVLHQLAALRRTRYVSPVLSAQVCAALGESDAALGFFDDAVALRSTDLAWIAVRPVFDALHDNPRFRALLATIGLRTTTPGMLSSRA